MNRQGSLVASIASPLLGACTKSASDSGDTAAKLTLVQPSAVPLVATTTDLLLADAPRLRRMAGRLTRCAADADDLVQTTLLKAYTARDRFQEGTSIRAWTSTILRRAFFTRVTSEKRRRTELAVDVGDPLDRFPGRVSRWSHDRSPSADELEEQLGDDLKRALGSVPAIYRHALSLYALQGMTCAEIADVLAVRPGTVMSRIHRARVVMRRELAGDGGALARGRGTRLSY